MSEAKRKAKKKTWFARGSKNGAKICPGQRGFLVFCNNREREAIREAKSLFDEFYTQNPAVGELDGGEESDGEEIDVDEELEREAKKLKGENSSARAKKETFQLMVTGVQNVLFFKARIADTLAVSTAIMDSILTEGAQKTRHLLRLVPVQATCKAYVENIRECVAKVFAGGEEKFPNLTYSVMFKSRCNQDVDREDVIKAASGAIKAAVPDARVEYKNPGHVVMVEVMKANCCVSVLPDYLGKYKKYNLVELANKREVGEKAGEA